MSDSDKKALSAGDWFFGTVLHMGASWKTTLGGILNEIFTILTLLSIAPYTLPSEISGIIPPGWKAKLLVVAASCKTIVAVWTWWNTKSKNVVGGDTQQTLDGSIAKPGTQTLVDLTKEAKPVT